MAKALLLFGFLSVVVPLVVVVGAQVPADPMVDRARRLLREVPVIDGHNDYPWEVRQKAQFRSGEARHAAAAADRS